MNRCWVFGVFFKEDVMCNNLLKISLVMCIETYGYLFTFIYLFVCLFVCLFICIFSYIFNIFYLLFVCLFIHLQLFYYTHIDIHTYSHT